MTTHHPTTLDRFRGCLLGGAVGDALGAAIEFDSLERIRVRFGARGLLDPVEAYGRVGAITDDTQMTLFTAEALLQADDRLERGVGHPANQLWAAYQRWLETQGEQTVASRDVSWVWHGELHRERALFARRAPGNTCLSALRRSRPEDSLHEIIDNDSKGCGGVMRAAPCGLVGDRYGQDGAFRLGVTAAGLTHGHPSGYLSAGALAVIIERLAARDPLDRALDTAIGALRGQPRAGEVIDALNRARTLGALGPAAPDDARQLGEGWVAEEALAIAVYAVLRHADDFAAAVRLAANHGGDSDSTAALAGNMAGTLLGAHAIPSRWLATLELRETIDRLATAMHRRFVEGQHDVGWDLWQWRDAAEMAPPPHDAFWVEEGRLLAGPYPGAKDREQAEAKLSDFLALGVTCFIDLTEEGESGLKPYASLLRRVADGRRQSAAYLRLPIRDIDVPPAWRMRVIQHAISTALDDGEIVYVHCWGGVGRTGTVVGCRLVETAGLPGEQAIRRLAELRNGTQRAHRTAPESKAQVEMVQNWRPVETRP